MAEAPIGMPNRISDLYSQRLTGSSPRWRDWVPQSRLCSAGKQQARRNVERYTVVKVTDQIENIYRIFRSIHTLQSSDGLYYGPKSDLETLWLRISCAVMKQLQLGQCYRSRIQYANQRTLG